MKKVILLLSLILIIGIFFTSCWWDKDSSTEPEISTHTTAQGSVEMSSHYDSDDLRVISGSFEDSIDSEGEFEIGQTIDCSQMLTLVNTSTIDSISLLMALNVQDEEKRAGIEINPETTAEALVYSMPLVASSNTADADSTIGLIKSTEHFSELVSLIRIQYNQGTINLDDYNSPIYEKANEVYSDLFANILQFAENKQSRSKGDNLSPRVMLMDEKHVNETNENYLEFKVKNVGKRFVSVYVDFSEDINQNIQYSSEMQELLVSPDVGWSDVFDGIGGLFGADIEEFEVISPDLHHINIPENTKTIQVNCYGVGRLNEHFPLSDTEVERLAKPLFYSFCYDLIFPAFEIAAGVGSFKNELRGRPWKETNTYKYFIKDLLKEFFINNASTGYTIFKAYLSDGEAEDAAWFVGEFFTDYMLTHPKVIRDLLQRTFDKTISVKKLNKVIGKFNIAFQAGSATLAAMNIAWFTHDAISTYAKFTHPFYQNTNKYTIKGSAGGDDKVADYAQISVLNEDDIFIGNYRTDSNGEFEFMIPRKSNGTNFKLIINHHIFDEKEASFEVPAGTNTSTPYDIGKIILSEINVPPYILITKPVVFFDTFVIGDAINIKTYVYDANGDDDITKVELYIDDELIKEDTVAPYEFDWSSNGSSAGQHIIKTIVYDSAGNSSFNTHTITLEETINLPPNAVLEARKDNGTTSSKIHFYGWKSSDDKDEVWDAWFGGEPDSTKHLRFRFDFENDGVFDTEWMYENNFSYNYNEEGNYSVKLEVKDTEGEIDYDTIVINIENDEITSAELVYVEGGSFLMGSTEGDSDEEPIHLVEVSSFYIGKYEVNQKEYETVTGSINSFFKNNNSNPVESVSWSEAVRFCNKLSLRNDLDTCYTGNLNSWSETICDFSKNGFRLPTEAEWEFAAKGGNLSNNYLYSGSNNLDDVAWYNDNSENITHPVGQKIPNELGIYDMSGNVIEWCWDWYGEYNSNQLTNPTGPTEQFGLGGDRIHRGGGWCYGLNRCRVTDRHNNAGNGYSDGYCRGVRIVKKH